MKTEAAQVGIGESVNALEIKTLMQKHDWYYKFADDRKSWTKGLEEKRKIMEKLVKVPMNQIPELLKLVPGDLHDDWKREIQLVGLNPELKEKFPSEGDEE